MFNAWEYCGMRTKAVFVVVLGLILTQMVSGQSSSGPVSSSSILLALPTSGAAFSAEQSEERVVSSADGAQTREVKTTKIFRDSAGRIRAEHVHDDANEQSATFVLLIDPPARTLVTSFPTEKKAMRITVTSAEGFGYAFPIINGELGVGSLGTKTAELGTRVIDGIEFRGTRTEPADQNPESVLTFTERWHSVQLGLTQSIVVVNATGRVSAALKHIHRSEPDPALFKVPPTYDIEEVKWPVP